MHELSVLCATARGSCPGAKGNKSNQHMQQTYLWTTREQICVSRAGQLDFDSAVFKGCSWADCSFKAQTVQTHSGKAQELIEHTCNISSNENRSEAFPGTYWTLAWITLQGPHSSPQLTGCSAALSALLHSLSQVHPAPSPLPGAPHLQENGIQAQNMEGRHRKHPWGPLPPHPGNKDLQDKLCSKSDLGFLCARGCLESIKTLS